MSTLKKDGAKVSSSRKQSTSVPKTTSKIREDSTDRKHVKRVEESIKNKTKQPSVSTIKQKTISSTRVDNNTKDDKIIKKTTSNASRKPDISTSESKRKVPGTPTSKRVSKSQFFPSKNMYSNALKSSDISTKSSLNNNRENENNKKIDVTESNVNKPRKSRDVISKTETKTASSRKPSRVIDEIRARRLAMKQSKPKSIEDPRTDTSPDSSTISERPRTATLRKGSIVNTNIVGPEAPKKLSPKIQKELVILEPPGPKSDHSGEDNYEDDFESYESDFEEYSSSESPNPGAISGEETSSVNSDSSSDSPAPQELMSSQKRVSSASTDEEKKLDSGNFDMPDYRHKQMLDNIKESVEKENANFSKQEVQRNNPASLSDEGFEDQKSLQFINFLDAQKKYDKRKNLEEKQRRGEQILSMIRLDTFSFTLFDLPPVPYEIFIKTYGNSNTVQTSVQTGEDDVDEEVQTEDISYDSKWTQLPTKFSKINSENPDFWKIYKSEYLGVGGDRFDDDFVKKSIDEESLNKFLLSAGELILRLQEESSLENSTQLKKNNREIPFSDGYIEFNTKSELLRNSKVQYVSFCCDNSNKFLTVHTKSDDLSTVIAVWEIASPENPYDILMSHGSINCSTFGTDALDYIYAGHCDGTISLWSSKKSMLSINENCQMRTPVYTSHIGLGHYNTIVAIHPIIESSEIDITTSTKTREICSLDEEGEIILWSVIVKTGADNFSDDIVLVKNTTVDLRNVYPDLTDLQCTDFALSLINSNIGFISTNYGFIIHHFVKGGRTNVKKFLAGSPSTAICLSTCSFSTDHFLAGYENGNIHLYSTSTENPLMVLSDKESNIDTCSIELIQWSKTKPFVIYTKDKSNTIHIWDLSESDLFPICSVPFDKKITCMQLSPICKDEEKDMSYMLIGTEDGCLHLHQLSKEHGQQPKEMFEEHVSTFKNYVNRF